MRRSGAALLGIGILASGMAARAGTIEVALEVPQKSRVDMEKEGYATVFFPAFLPAKEISKDRGYAFEREASRFFERLFAKETKLKVVDAGTTPLPFSTLDELAADPGFWRKLADERGADLILTGQVDFRHSNRSGYVQSNYQSSFTAAGQPSMDRPVFVYRSGMTLVLDVVLIEGRTGEVLYQDRFLKDKTVDGSGGDPLQNFFDLMRAVQINVLGLVTPQKATVTRYLID